MEKWEMKILKAIELLHEGCKEASYQDGFCMGCPFCSICLKIFEDGELKIPEKWDVPALKDIYMT